MVTSGSDCLVRQILSVSTFLCKDKTFFFEKSKFVDINTLKLTFRHKKIFSAQKIGRYIDYF
jgi:hypothetical protein